MGEWGSERRGPSVGLVVALLLYDRRYARDGIEVLADQFFVVKFQCVMFLDERYELEDSCRVEDTGAEERLFCADMLLLVKEDFGFDVGGEIGLKGLGSHAVYVGDHVFPW